MQGPFQKGHPRHSQSQGSREPQSAPQPALAASVTLQHPGMGAAGTNSTNLLQTRPPTPAGSRPLSYPRSPALLPQKLPWGCGSRDGSRAPRPLPGRAMAAAPSPQTGNRVSILQPRGISI